MYLCVCIERAWADGEVVEETATTYCLTLIVQNEAAGSIFRQGRQIDSKQ